MAHRTVAILALLLLLASACTASKPPEQAIKLPDAKPCIADFRKKLDEDPAKCAHVWEQVGVHPYERSINGLPNIELCTITRCSKCGAVRHECQARRR